jgi:phosphoglycerate dehydrogenase-like enzyme
MEVIAWSQNLTQERAAQAQGVRLASKDELFRQADIVTIHLVFSRRTPGLVGAAELAVMKRSARLVNTSRRQIIEEAALVEALRERKIAGAAIDVFDVEPLPPDIHIGRWRIFLPPRISATSLANFTAHSIATR